MKHSQIAVGDVELHVVEIGAGKPVVFRHGFPDVWIGWRRQMEAAAAAGYRAVAVDMRGYGRSTGPEDPTAYTMFHTVGDMVGLLDALELLAVTIVGHDFGAATARYAAMMRPDRFTAVFGFGRCSPASTGAQNDLRYACFPGSRRLAIQQGGQVRVYDTGEHRISGFSQQQGGDQSLTFTSQYGLVRVADLVLVVPEGDRPRNPAPSDSAPLPAQAPQSETRAAPTAPPPAAQPATEDIVKTIERLAELRQKNILTEEEFASKKAELLSRL